MGLTYMTSDNVPTDRYNYSGIWCAVTACNASV